jgi:DNA phosphorothioation-associated putative methyltransferase
MLVIAIDWRQLEVAVKGMPFGKRLPGAVYVHRQAAACRVQVLSTILKTLATLHHIGDEFNVVKFRTDAPRLSFLSYPTFDEDPHPALTRAIALDLVTGKAYSSSYQDNLNPPILHRKELLVGPEHPRFSEFASLTAAEETAGLYQSSLTIGFRLNWQRLLDESGIELVGHTLKRTGNSGSSHLGNAGTPVHRHKTALTRYDLSKPVKTLLEYGQLKPSETFFDFGCGLGTDIQGLQQLGYQAAGWDPVHAPYVEKTPAGVVNLGYVLNVIEDPAERLETLLAAWSLADRLLVISAMISSSSIGHSGLTFGDGQLTSRNTFQKYFAQKELQQYIEDGLECSAIPVALGVFYVFRDPLEHQTFLQSRSRRAVDWSSVSLVFDRPTVRTRVPREPKVNRYEEHQHLLDAFWTAALTLGRPPEPWEFLQHDELIASVGGPTKALRYLLVRHGQEVFEKARATRRNDLLVYLASANLRRRIPLTQLPKSIQVDVRNFFGSYQRGLEEGLKLLYSAADPNTIQLACDDSSIGWQDEGSLYIHAELVSKLPIVLRVYVACAELLFGSASQADLVKLHKSSGKVTFLTYRDFDRSILPELTTRSKVNLRTGTVDVYEHSGQGQLLYFKERFLDPNDPRQESLTGLHQRLRWAGVSEDVFLGPNERELGRMLAQLGLTLAELMAQTGQDEVPVK